jgi:hypothetical protein
MAGLGSGSGSGTTPPSLAGSASAALFTPRPT